MTFSTSLDIVRLVVARAPQVASMARFNNLPQSWIENFFKTVTKKPKAKFKDFNISSFKDGMMISCFMQPGVPRSSWIPLDIRIVPYFNTADESRSLLPDYTLAVGESYEAHFDRHMSFFKFVFSGDLVKDLDCTAFRKRLPAEAVEVTARAPQGEVDTRTFTDKIVIDRLLKKVVGSDFELQRHPHKDHGSDYQQVSWVFKYKGLWFCFVITSVGPNFEHSDRAFLGLTRGYRGADVSYNHRIGVYGGQISIEDADSKNLKSAMDNIVELESKVKPTR